ncbi:solute carrier family 22 member 22-like isoform X2 [Perognathus longimembris pacificus]|uniref:solute carrier family 22 member 22-like isoform X2 n=1 Tax=Perognathus longimembris pacificus TaxID=214514 RepID=UPI002019442A|nr:solute carrier family 22 member 22-like isoform X2 [Perognathus longimembris pacificus]
MAFEELLQQVGDCGRYHIFTTVLLILLGMLSSPHDFMENFTGAIPAHHCSVHLLDNPQLEFNITTNLTAKALLRVSILLDPNQNPEQCRRFHKTQWQLLIPNVTAAMNITELETEPCLDGWTYDQSVFTSTIVTEWDLVCDFQSFKYFAQTITLAGHLVGTPISGILSDKFGWKPLLVATALGFGILGIACAFAPSFILYCFFKFLMSACLSAFQNSSIIILLEGTSQKWYPRVATVKGLSWSAGHALLAGLAYAIRDWHKLQLAISLPFFILSFFVCWVSESVLWLMTNGKTERALRELQRIANINGKKDVAQSLTTEMIRFNMKERRNETRSHCRITEVIVNPTVFRTALFKWSFLFAGFFSYYGLLLDIRVLGTDIFMTQFLLAVTDFPSKLASYFIIRHVKRRPSVAFLLCMMGGSIIVIIFVPIEMNILRLIIFLFGKACYSSFSVLCTVFTTELSPTILRSTLQAFYIFSLRISMTCASLVLVTGKYFVHLPMILYGVLPIVALTSLYFLPETYNLPLPNTIKDLEKREAYQLSVSLITALFPEQQKHLKVINESSI